MWSERLGRRIEGDEVFVYCFAILGSTPFHDSLQSRARHAGRSRASHSAPDLFEAAVELGRRLVWLQTFGTRFTSADRPASTVPPGRARCTQPVSEDAEQYPDTATYDPQTLRLSVGTGVFEPVAPEVYNFEVSGYSVVRSWLAYRSKEGSGKRSSELDTIRPTRWPAAFTHELLELLWVMEHSVTGFAEDSRLLDQVLEGPSLGASALPPVPAEYRSAGQALPLFNDDDQ